MDVTIQTITAINRDLSQPIVYSFCNTSSQTIPAMNAAIQTLAYHIIYNSVHYRTDEGSEKCRGYSFCFTKQLCNDINYHR